MKTSDLVFATSLISESLVQAKILTDLVLVWISRQETKIPSLSPFSFKRKRVVLLSDINPTNHTSRYLKSEQSTGLSNWKPQHSERRRKNGFGKSPISVVNQMTVWIILAQHLQLHLRTQPQTYLNVEKYKRPAPIYCPSISDKNVPKSDEWWSPPSVRD